MNAGLKRRLDDLNELLEQKYITETEYAAARENVLLDAGFDIVPRPSGFSPDDGAAREVVQVLQPNLERRSGCGCLVVLLLLALVAAAGGVFALPEETARSIPVLGRLLENETVQDVRQTLARFIDDLKGNPLPDGTLSEPPAPSEHSEHSEPPELSEPLQPLQPSQPLQAEPEASTELNGSGNDNRNENKNENETENENLN